MESLIGHTVIDMSDETLSKAQVSALEKGLTFFPKPDSKRLRFGRMSKNASSG